MADLTPVIETMENRWMRAWVQRDQRGLKAVTARQFTLLVGSKPAVILDQRSWLDAAVSRFTCTSWRFGDIYVRDIGGFALFGSQMELNASLDGHDWSGRVWVTDLWRKGRVRRSWRMVQRVMSRTEEDKEVPARIRGMQLWR